MIDLNKTNFNKSGDVKGSNYCIWSKCRTIEENSESSLVKLGIWLKEIDETNTLSIFKKSGRDLWDTIKKPTSYDPSLYFISETTKETKQRNLTELQNNIYILFDYKIHQYWCDNYLQTEFSKSPSEKKMFGRDSNMCLIVNAHDDWQFRFSDKFKYIINHFFNDNRNLSKRFSDTIRKRCVGYFRCYQDIKAFLSDKVIQTMRYHEFNQTSISWPEELNSLAMARVAKLQLKSYLKNQYYEITKLSDQEVEDDSINFESSIQIGGNNIGVFEKPKDMIFINHIDNVRHLGIARELREAVRQSKLEFALEPYKEYLNLPEINYYRQKGQLEATQTSITIKNCALILAFGMKRLIDDIQSQSVVPGFKMTNEDDYRVVQPKFKLLSFKNPKYEEFRDKFGEHKASIHRLYNSTMFLKFNAIRYFYHSNSYYRDWQHESDHVIEGTDMNIIYKEQIDDEIESIYSTRERGRNVYKIIHGTSMIESCLNIASLDPQTTNFWK